MNLHIDDAIDALHKAKKDQEELENEFRTWKICMDDLVKNSPYAQEAYESNGKYDSLKSVIRTFVYMEAALIREKKRKVSADNAAADLVNPVNGERKYGL